MKKDDVLNHFGSVKSISEKLEIDPVAVYQWPEIIPELQAFRLDFLTSGALRYRSDPYDKQRAAKAILKKSKQKKTR